MATNAANSTPPAGEDETETPEVEVVEPVEEETDDGAADADDPDVEAAAAKAAKDAEEADRKPKDDDEEEPEEPPSEAAKALKDQTVEELSKQLSEDQLRRLGQKFANKTMAAARRAERDTEVAKTENAKLAGELTSYRQFVDQLKASPMQALRRVLGPDLTFKKFAELVSGQPDAEPAKVDPRVEALERKLAEKEAREREATAEANTRASQARVAEALGKEGDRFDLVLTDIGQAHLWEAIVAYHGKYGSCPDAKVFEMADKIEERLTGSLAKSKKFSAVPAQKGTPAGAKPSPVAKGKTITNRSSAGAPATRANPAETEAERERRINAEMKAAGELA